MSGADASSWYYSTSCGRQWAWGLPYPKSIVLKYRKSIGKLVCILIEDFQNDVPFLVGIGVIQPQQQYPKVLHAQPVDEFSKILVLRDDDSLLYIRPSENVSVRHPRITITNIENIVSTLGKGLPDRIAGTNINKNFHFIDQPQRDTHVP